MAASNAERPDISWRAVVGHVEWRVETPEDVAMMLRMVRTQEMHDALMRESLSTQLWSSTLGQSAILDQFGRPIHAKRAP